MLEFLAYAFAGFLLVCFLLCRFWIIPLLHKNLLERDRIEITKLEKEIELLNAQFELEKEMRKTNCDVDRRVSLLVKVLKQLPNYR